MKNIYILTMVILGIGSLVLSGCGCGKKTEREQYESAISGIKYKTYKALSSEVFPPLFKTYNSEAADSLQVREETGRLLLGYFWMCSGKTSFGFAEGNIILEESNDETFKAIAKMLIAIGMYENGWKELAKEETKDATAKLDKLPDGSYVKLEITMIHLLMGTFAVYQKDFEGAKFQFAGFANLSGINWPYQLVDGMGEIEKGNIQTGLQKVKAMTTDESVPKEVRESLKVAISEVEASTGSVDSALFWPKAISLALYGQLRSAGQSGIDSFMGLIDQIREKVEVL